MKNFKKTLLVLLICGSLLSFAGCDGTKESSSSSESSSTITTTATQTETEAQTDDEASVTASTLITTSNAAIEGFDDDDYAIELSNVSTTKITLNGSTASCDNSSVTCEDGNVTITAAGVYVISGSLDDGQIIVDSEAEGVVNLVFNGVTLYCSDSAPVYVKNAEKAVITLADCTTNTVTDNSTYDETTELDETGAYDGPDAAIFSKQNLTFNGTGTLTVSGNYKNAIASKDKLKFNGGTYNLTAVNSGIVGKDYLLIGSGTFDITANEDGIKSTQDSDTALGYVAILGGNIKINSGYDGIQAVTNIFIEGGTVDITSGGGTTNAAAHAENDMGGGSPWGDTTSDADDTNAESTKGIKSDYDINISGGTITINSADDSIHSNNNVTISGGTFNIAAGDDGIHADTSLCISDGDITITESYEALESSTTMEISGGKINVTASDDGVNVSGTSGSDASLTISGGCINLNANGDGLDSNGSISMTGGEAYVYGPTNDGNGSLDYDQTFSLTGGTLLAVGSSGMLQTPSSDTQIILSYSATLSGGEDVKITNSAGETVYEFTAEKTAASVVYTSDKLTAGETYTLYIDGTESSSLSSVTTGVNGTSGSGMGMGGGMQQPGGGGGMGGNFGGQGW